MQVKLRSISYYFRVISVALLLFFAVSIGSAQTEAEQGDPPIKALISISSADNNGIVTISGVAGAVFPAATVAVRNLYTGEVVYTNAGITGSFNASLYGPGNTPFWISPAPSIPNNLRDRPGSLPGGPGTIIYGAPPESREVVIPTTQIVMDTNVDDWLGNYPQAQLEEGIFALFNQNLLYFAYTPAEFLVSGDVSVIIQVDDASYEYRFNAYSFDSAQRRQLLPTETDFIGVDTALTTNEMGDVVEAKFSLDSTGINAESVVLLDRLLIHDLDEEIEPEAIILEAPIPYVDERNGIVYADGVMTGNLTRFSASGTGTLDVFQQADLNDLRWDARGRIRTLEADAGDNIPMQVDFSVTVPDLATPVPRVIPRPQITMQPIAVDRDGDGIAEQNVVADGSNNGWSSMMTRTGLALDNLSGGFTLSRITVTPATVIRRDDTLLFGAEFDLGLPDDLPDGIYIFTLSLGDGTPTRLPVVINIGEITEARLPFVLLHDTPSDGSRGIIAQEDEGIYALSNRVRFNSDTRIFAPGEYSLEPYLPNLMPNSYENSSAPLIPLLFPGGRLNVTVIRPDGAMDELPSAAIVQNRLGTAMLDERDNFGAQAPLDVYRLTTLNPELTAYNFDVYGDYVIEVNGTVEDIYGNRYTGGGTYTLTIAEMLDFTPAVLAGTPFETDDTVYVGGHVAPQVPAEITVTAWHFPADGSDTVETIITGTANTYGAFMPDEVLTFDSGGEYIISYEARYTDGDGRLWASSMTTAGVIASIDTSLVVRGERGLATYDDNPQAWYSTANYPYDTDATPDAIVNYPYHNGDVVYLADSDTHGVNPILQVQDIDGQYRDWLVGTIGGSYENTLFTRLAAEGRLPLIHVLGGPDTPFLPALLPDFIVSQAYGYVSAVRPDVTVRQFVQGSASGDLPLYWDNDDPLNQQIGAGNNGLMPGDYVFLFGGIVVQNAEAGLQDTAIYASVVVIGDEDSPAQVIPPFQADDGLIQLNGTDLESFFLPTALHPAQVMQAGETVSLVGQVAPALQSQIMATITAPDGTERLINGMTNSIGYFYDDANDFTADQTGDWTIEIAVIPTALTSISAIDTPLPQGGIPAVTIDQFEFYVLPADAPTLTWNGNTNAEITRNATTPFNITLDVPAGWTDTQARVRITTPSYLVSNENITVRGTTVTYQYNQSTLASTVTNLESSGSGDSASGSDTVTLTFIVTGTNTEGDADIRTRTFTIFHNRLITLATGGDAE